MTNFGFMHTYVYAGENEHRKYQNLSFSDDCLYSYSTVIAKKFRSYKIFLVSKNKYSVTTTRHLDYLERSIPSNWTIIYCNVNDYRDLETLHKYFINEADYMLKRFVKLRDNKLVFRYPNDRKGFIDLIDQWIKLNEHCKKSKKVYKKYINYYNANKEYQFSYIDKQAKTAELAKKRKEEQYEKIYQNIVKYVEDNNIQFNISTYDNQEKINAIYNHFSWSAQNLQEQQWLPTYRVMCKRYLFNNVYEGKYSYDLSSYPYHAYLDKKKNVIHTTGYVDIERKFFGYTLALMHVYLNEPETTVLVGKHIGPFTIISNNSNYVQIGCHRLLYKNVELLYKDLKEYLNGKENIH